jgi:hypothetical protein
MKKVGGNVGYVVHRVLKGRFIALGGLVKAADFSDELERRCPNLFVGDWRLKVEKRFDIPAHISGPQFEILPLNPGSTSLGRGARMPISALSSKIAIPELAPRNLTPTSPASMISFGSSNTERT